jgi:multiple sugar transport system ATP-binding protein
LLDRKPRNLSGGQRQRVAMGRAIVREPAVFLMDEPLSNLDAKLRVQRRAENARIQRELGTTTIYVTHDQTEAMTMGDRVAVLKRGVLQQVDTPQVLYDWPVNLFVGGFIGSPAMNLFEAEVVEDDDELWVQFGHQRLPVTAELLERRPALRRHVGSRVVLGIRPESFADPAAQGHADDARVQVQVEVVERLGSEVYAHFSIEARPVQTEDTRELMRDRADLTDTALDRRGAAETTPGVARLDPETGVAEGASAELAVDTRRLYFFDLDSGLAIGDAPTGSDRPAVVSSGAVLREDDRPASDE